MNSLMGVATTTTTCRGCGTASAECFQCPLCLAEQQTEHGFYCSQPCFAQNWLAHRSERHKSGVARERAGKAANTATQEATTAAGQTKRTKKSKTTGEIEDADAAHKEAEQKDACVKEGRTKKSAKPATDANRSATTVTSSSTDAPVQQDANQSAPHVTRDETVATSRPHYAPWPIIPSLAMRQRYCNGGGADAVAAATITPPLQTNTPRAVIALHDSPANAAQACYTAANAHTQQARLSAAMWPSIISAVDYVAMCLPESARRVLVVAPEASAAGAFAWAARCAKLSSLVQLIVATTTHDDNRDTSKDSHTKNAVEKVSSVWSRTRILVTTQTLLREQGSESPLMAWLHHEEGSDVADSLLVTLPGVSSADSLQRVHTRALFFVTPLSLESHTSPTHENESTSTHSHTRSESGARALRNGHAPANSNDALNDSATVNTLACLTDNHDADGWYSAGEITHRLSPMTHYTPQRHDACANWHWSPAPLRVPHPRATPRIDDALINACASGNAAAAVHARIAELHRLRRCTGLEEVVHNSLLCGWGGAMSVAHAHHRLARLMRYAVDEDRATTGGSALASASSSSRRLQQPPPTGMWCENTELTLTSTHASHRSGLARGLHSALRSGGGGGGQTNYKHDSMTAIAVRAILPLCRLLPPLQKERLRTATHTGRAPSAVVAGGETKQTSAAHVARVSRESQTGNSKSSSTQRRTPRTQHSPHETSHRAPDDDDDDSASDGDGDGDVSNAERNRYANYYSHIPNLQLQATLCYLQTILTPRLIDDLAACWAMDRLLPRTLHPAHEQGTVARRGGSRRTRKRSRASDATPLSREDVEQEEREKGDARLLVHHRARAAVIHRLRIRYAARVGTAVTDYLVILMHLCYDAVAVYSWTVRRLAAALLWRVTLESELGAMEDFLALCQLLHPIDAALHDATNHNHNNNNNSDSRQREQDGNAGNGVNNAPNSKEKESGEDLLLAAPTSLSSRIIVARKMSQAEARREAKQRAAEQLRRARRHAVRAAHVKQYIPLPWITLPLSHARQRQVTLLRRQACEEILMAMPRQPRPMYVSDVGNLIGRWSAFNARYDGALGVSLVEFAQSMPESFRVVGTLITRRRAGANKAIRIRYDKDEDGVVHRRAVHGNSDDENEGEDDVDETGHRTKSASGTTGGGQSGLSARARKKRARKEFNKSRFNRNYKAMDASARVPGYVKHAPRRVKGRGRKVNKRVVKRGN